MQIEDMFQFTITGRTSPGYRKYVTSESFLLMRRNLPVITVMLVRNVLDPLMQYYSEARNVNTSALLVSLLSTKCTPSLLYGTDRFANTCRCSPAAAICGRSSARCRIIPTDTAKGMPSCSRVGRLCRRVSAQRRSFSLRYWAVPRSTGQ